MTTTGNDNSTQHSDWDQQREQLSAYLDGELDDGERKRLEGHLVDCAECQRELAELRQVRALLRALPTPALPRSFALPVEEPAIAVSARRASATPAAAARPAPRRESRLARAAQWTGGLAASVGLLLVLGSALAGGGFSPSSGGTAAPAGAPAQRSTNSSTNSGTATHAPQVGVNGNGTQTPRSTSSAAPVISPAASPAQPNDTGTATYGQSNTPSSGSSTRAPHTFYGIQSPSLSSSAVLELTGAGLAGGGALLFVGGTISRRRRRIR